MEGFILTIYFLLTLPLVFVGNGALMLFGYNVTNDVEKVAEQIVKQGKDAEEWYDIRFFTNVMGPTFDAVRRTYVYKYAQLTKDPSACELLMPSKYGWSCIGKIWGPLIDENNCHWYKENKVRCFEGEALTPHIYSFDQKNISSLPNEIISHTLCSKVHL